MDYKRITPKSSTYKKITPLPARIARYAPDARDVKTAFIPGVISRHKDVAGDIPKRTRGTRSWEVPEKYEYKFKNIKHGFLRYR